MAHTQGPWYTTTKDSDLQGRISSEVDGRSIAVTYATQDAYLIAAAPDLLEALKTLYPSAARRIGGTTDGTPILAAAREAIAKAEGNE